MLITPGKPRRDGKLPVTFQFDSGRVISKVMTAEQLEKEIERAKERGSYGTLESKPTGF